MLEFLHLLLTWAREGWICWGLPSANPLQPWNLQRELLSHLSQVLPTANKEEPIGHSRGLRLTAQTEPKTSSKPQIQLQLHFYPDPYREYSGIFPGGSWT